VSANDLPRLRELGDSSRVIAQRADEIDRSSEEITSVRDRKQKTADRKDRPSFKLNWV
jgi:hypothetical protein